MKIKRFLGAITPVVVGLLVAAVLKTFVVFNAVVPTSSMEPTIMAGDRLVGSKLSYCFNDPERGDIVTFLDPEGSETFMVKRIIGLPGETVTILSGMVYIDGDKIPLTEAYINPDEEPVGDFGPFVVPDDSYFVLGDNRNSSYDSRYWTVTSFIERDKINSKILFRYYPELNTIN